MNLESIFSSEIFRFVVLPLLIFLARALDVSLGTIRIVFVSKGLKYLAPVVGFFEVIIWLLAIRVIMHNLNNVACYIAYGAGFAMGTFIGIQIERKLAIGTSIIRVITQKDATELVSYLREKGYGVTCLDAQGKGGIVHVVYLIIRRCDFEIVVDTIQKYNPNAFYTVEDVNAVSKGTFLEKKHHFYLRPLRGPFRFGRKGK